MDRRRLVTAIGALVVLLGVGVFGTALLLAVPEKEPVRTPYTPPDDEPDLSRLSAEDRSLVEHYTNEQHVLAGGTWIFVAPMTVDEAVSRLLGPDPPRATPADRRQIRNLDASRYGFLQVGEGVVAHEPLALADPPRRVLAALSREGAVAAVTTSDIELNTRFGYARDGRTVFDVSDYPVVDSVTDYPSEIRELASLAWLDPEEDSGADAGVVDWVAVGQALCEKVTGVRADASAKKVEEQYLVPLPW